MVKLNPKVSSSRRKARKAHFTAPSHVRRVIMSSRLSKALREKHSVKTMPVRKDDEVIVKRGKFKNAEGKVTGVFRKKFVIFVEHCTKDKNNGQSVPVGIHPSNVEITKLHMDKDRRRTLERRGRSASGATNTDKEQSMAEVD